MKFNINDKAYYIAVINTIEAPGKVTVKSFEVLKIEQINGEIYYSEDEVYRRSEKSLFTSKEEAVQKILADISKL